MSDLLFIYNANDWPNKTVRPDADVTIGVTDGRRGLKKALDQLMSTHKKFGRVAFNTHGQSGQINFSNGSYIDALTLKSDFRGYVGLFSANTRIYFGGCNVAEGDDGWEFLETAADVFLSASGGVTFAYTSLGFLFRNGLLFFIRYYMQNLEGTWCMLGVTRDMCI